MAGPVGIDRDSTLGIATVGNVLRQMIRCVLKGVPQVEYIEWRPFGHPVATVGGGQVVFTHPLGLADEVGIYLVGFGENVGPGAVAILGEDDWIPLFEIDILRLRPLLHASLYPGGQAPAPE